jgi:hypothetical protein
LGSRVYERLMVKRPCRNLFPIRGLFFIRRVEFGILGSMYFFFKFFLITLGKSVHHTS